MPDHRAVTRCAVTRCALSVALAVSLASAGFADWPLFRGTPDRLGYAPQPPGTVLVPLWTTQLPAETVNNVSYAPSIVSSPAVVGDTVYVGSQNAHMYALDAATGAKRWEYPSSEAITSSPLVRDGLVYFVPMNGDLTALNATTGAKVWSLKVGGLQDYSSPNIVGDNVVVGASYPNSMIYAVPKLTGGTTAWTVPTNQPVLSSPAVEPTTGAIYVGTNAGALYALWPNGIYKWDYPAAVPGGIFLASPAVANGKVYLSGGDFDYALHAWDMLYGFQVWTADMTPPPPYNAVKVSSPAVDGSFIAVVGGYGNGQGPSILYAFEDMGLSVKSLWTVPLPNYTNQGFVSSPALTQKFVVVGVAARADAAHPTYPQGRIYMVDRQTGKPQWYAAGSPATGVNGGPILSSPAISGNLVVIGDTSGLVTAYQIAVAGDVDGDGTVTVQDAVRAARIINQMQLPLQAQIDRGDIVPAGTVRPDGSRSFGDGVLNWDDVGHILQRAAGLEDATQF